MYAMTPNDKRELDAYRATGLTPEEIEQLKQRSPIPEPDAGYAPLPLADHEDISLGAGLLEE